MYTLSNHTMSLIKQHLYNQALLEELRQDYFFMLNDIADEQEKAMMELMEERDVFTVHVTEDHDASMVSHPTTTTDTKVWMQ